MNSGLDGRADFRAFLCHLNDDHLNDGAPTLYTLQRLPHVPHAVTCPAPRLPVQRHLSACLCRTAYFHTCYLFHLLSVWFLSGFQRGQYAKRDAAACCASIRVARGRLHLPSLSASYGDADLCTTNNFKTGDSGRASDKHTATRLGIHLSCCAHARRAWRAQQRDLRDCAHFTAGSEHWEGV